MDKAHGRVSEENITIRSKLGWNSRPDCGSPRREPSLYSVWLVLRPNTAQLEGSVLRHIGLGSRRSGTPGEPCDGRAGRPALRWTIARPSNCRLVRWRSPGVTLARPRHRALVHSNYESTATTRRLADRSAAAQAPATRQPKKKPAAARPSGRHNSAILANLAPEGHPLGCSVLIRSQLGQSFLRCSKRETPRGSAVEYKQFFVKAFEQRPGKWRARVKRCDGRPLMVVGHNRVKIEEFVLERKNQNVMSQRLAPLYQVLDLLRALRQGRLQCARTLVQVNVLVAAALGESHQRDWCTSACPAYQHVP